MDLNDCKKKGLIRKTNVNMELINSLIEMSELNEQIVNGVNLNSINISSYVSMAYESLRQILEAICILKSYKVSSHLCLGELLKELDKDFEFNKFDRFRYIRNGINYYGVKVEFEQGKEIIKNLFVMKQELQKKYFGGRK